jgi:hypothetical protein
MQLIYMRKRNMEFCPHLWELPSFTGSNMLAAGTDFQIKTYDLSTNKIAGIIKWRKSLLV